MWASDYIRLSFEIDGVEKKVYTVYLDKEWLKKQYEDSYHTVFNIIKPNNLFIGYKDASERMINNVNLISGAW